jgi:ribose-phosphate pyrophosphokinase
MIDDIIDTGGSIVHGAEALKQRGANRVLAACTHGVFSRDALKKVEESVIEEIVCTDTVPVDADKREMTNKLRVISVAPLLADAIHRINKSESVSELFDRYW